MNGPVNTIALVNAAQATAQAINNLAGNVDALTPLLVPAVAATKGLTRAAIALVTLGANKTFATTGYSTQGDLGAGAIYTSVGATSGGLNAIQDAGGTWFNMVINGYNNVGWWGATADGTTDDTSAISLAIAHTPYAGTCFFPSGNYLVSNGFSITDTPITILGSGQSTNAGTAFLLASTFPGGTSLFSITTTAFLNGWRFESFAVIGGGFGNYAIEFKGTSGWLGALINYITVTDMGSGYSIGVTGAATTSGLAYSTISNCNLNGGIYILFGGDGLRIIGNVISGLTSKVGIYYNGVSGAAGLYIESNVISGTYVLIAIDNAVTPVIFANELETGTTTFGASSCVQIGAGFATALASNILAPQYINNQISVQSGSGDPIALYINKATNTNVWGGRFLFGNSAATAAHVSVDTNALNTYINIGNATEYLTIGGAPVSIARITDSGTGTHQALDLLQGQIYGTNTNDLASAGNIGERIAGDVAVASSVSLTSGVAADITSISLTAGDWDVWGSIGTNPAVTTTTSATLGWLDVNSATLPSDTNAGAYVALPFATAAGAGIVVPIGQRRLGLATTTTVYLSCYVNFAVSTCGAFGSIRARRRR